MSLPNEPITRKEQYLAKAAGQDVEIPAKPITREEEYLEAIAKKPGGGGGTSDYEQLDNLPQINNTTLTGNKSASDLGLVAAEEGKGLSENNYTDADKEIVGGVTGALAGKQGALTKGDYINIDGNNKISVNRNIVRDNYDYEIKTLDSNRVRVIKSQGTTVISSNDYTYQNGASHNIDNLFTLSSGYVMSVGLTWKYTLTVDSAIHEAGYSDSWLTSETKDVTESFPTEDLSGYKLVIKSELDAAVNAIKDGQNIDSFADVETALASKADTDMVAADFNAGTSYTAGNYCIYEGKFYKFKNSHSGAWSAADVDEIKIAGELSSLKSGLTNAIKYYNVPANQSITLNHGNFLLFALRLNQSSGNNVNAIYLEDNLMYNGGDNANPLSVSYSGGVYTVTNNNATAINLIVIMSS